MKKVVILGTGGNSVDILETLQALNAAAPAPKYECMGFLDDAPELRGKSIEGLPVLGPLDQARTLGDAFFVNGIGSPRNHFLKPTIIGRTGMPLDRFETVVHPSAQVSPSASLGRGTVVLQNATIAARAKVGAHVIVLPNSVLSHDDDIGDYTCVAGGVCVSGTVAVGIACYLGSNCSIIQNVRIGDFSMIGMGSVVLSDVPENAVYVGNPASFLRPSKPPG